MPKSNVSFWKEKFARNVERDARNRSDIENSGWRVITIWECETRTDGAKAKLRTIPTSNSEINHTKEIPC